MTAKKVVHLVEHHCAPGDCECSPTCRISADEIESSGFVRLTTCKRCLSVLAARGRRRDKARARLIASSIAWAEECAS